MVGSLSYRNAVISAASQEEELPLQSTVFGFSSHVPQEGSVFSVILEKESHETYAFLKHMILIPQSPGIIGP